VISIFNKEEAKVFIMSYQEYIELCDVKDRSVEKKDKPIAGSDGGDEDTETPKVEPVDITQKKDKYRHRQHAMLTGARYQARHFGDEFEEYAIVHRRSIDTEENITITLEVRSTIIRKALQLVLGDYPQFNLRSNPIVMKKPYVPLFHYRKEIREYTDRKDLSEKEKMHMLVLIKFMDRNFQDEEEEYNRLVPFGVISYDLLWTLLHPGQIVIKESDKLSECFKVVSFDCVGGDSPMLSILATSWNYDGAKFGHADEYLSMDSFSRTRKIDSLEVWPLNVEVGDNEDGIALGE